MTEAAAKRVGSGWIGMDLGKAIMVECGTRRRMKEDIKIWGLKSQKDKVPAH